jgi:excisionase family DNA binding protein
MTDRVLLRVDEAAQLLSLGRSTLYAMAASGTIPTVRVGRSLRIPREELNRWIEQRTEQAVDFEGPRP